MGPKEIWEEASHGLTCIPRCSCPLNNDEVPLKNTYKEAVFAFLRRAMQTSEDGDSDSGDGDILGNRAMQAG